MKNILETPEQIKAGVAVLKQGRRSEFWKLLSDIIRANIELIKDRILEGSDASDKEDMDRQRDRLKVYKEVLNTPDGLIKKLEGGTTVGINLDPYEHPSDDEVDSKASK